jgi:hypothetical protein
MIEQILNQTQQDGKLSSGPELPNRDEVQRMMQEFFKGKIKRRSAPIPTYCGCYAFRNPTPASNAFICANIKGTYQLMIVLGSDNDICTAYDPTEVEGGIKLVQMTKDEWTPLPTVIPEKPIKRWEHARECQVLSLWPSEANDWTTVFYKAVVKLQPCDRPESEERGYALDFGEGNVKNVPEAFVVTFPDNWKIRDEAKEAV